MTGIAKRVIVASFVVCALVLILISVALASLQLVDLYSTLHHAVYAEIRNTDNKGIRSGRLYYTLTISDPDDGKVLKTKSGSRHYTVAPRSYDRRLKLTYYGARYAGCKAVIELSYKDNKDKGNLGTRTLRLR